MRDTLSTLSELTTENLVDQDIKEWQTNSQYHQDGLDMTVTKFQEVSDILLERPNLNSSHLFRADILYDSTGKFQTVSEKEQKYGVKSGKSDEDIIVNSDPMEAPKFRGYTLIRTIVRRLIPRKPQLDSTLVQSCFVYAFENKALTSDKQIIVYCAHVEDEEQMPWYHPPIKALAYLCETHNNRASITIYYQPFSPTIEPIPTRLHRTLLSLLQTIVRLSKLEKPGSPKVDPSSSTASSRSTAPSALKDTILPQHTVQDTYTRLKQTYATDLIDRWIEKTEPSKHVFEDLSIAAFLIELWKQMYTGDDFPGFVDIACGNGVLVYILIKEGYHGVGFDARRRKTWEILEIDQYLEEKLCIPKPFIDLASEKDSLANISIHNGIFSKNTFIISNHADELTPWTPVLAALSHPGLPLPFLAIPCCSHALSGARHRYTLKDINPPSSSTVTPAEQPSSSTDQDPQSPTGDLKALRLAKSKASTHTDDKSQYACLTKKTVAIAEELGYQAEMTLIRIPSTRNIGIIGNRRRVTNANNDSMGSERDQDGSRKDGSHAYLDGDTVLQRIETLVARECAISGGVESAAQIWIERAKKLQTGRGRGKVNLGGKPCSDGH